MMTCGFVVKIKREEFVSSTQVCYSIYSNHCEIGVYSRNRAFRLFGSCKFGKNQSLSVSLSDRKRYRGIDGNTENVQEVVMIMMMMMCLFICYLLIIC